MTTTLDMMRRWLVSVPGQIDDPTQFPLLPGQMLVTGKSPMWSTALSTSTSGRERRRSNWSYPKWRFKIRYEVIRDRPSLPELSRLFAFFCLHRGQRDTFSYYDPYDHTATNELIGTGDGTRTIFQLTRSIGSAPGTVFTEPVRRVIEESVTVTVNGATVSGWLVDALGQLVLATPPAAAAEIRWTGQFMFLCRFNSDQMDPEQMTRDLWSLQGVELMSVKR